MKRKHLITTAGILLSAATAANATIIGFGNLGGNNTTVPGTLGSFANVVGNGFVVTNGATPNISLTWDTIWDIHTSTNFGPIENQTIGGGDWDNEGSIPRVGQLDTGNHTIIFGATPTWAVRINSFDFGLSGENPGTRNSVWTVSLTGATAGLVWSQSVPLENSLGASVLTLTPTYTPALNETYTLLFNRTADTGSVSTDGRMAIDNLSFNQIPEPSSMSLVGLFGVALLVRRRK